jgi:hypothetical protein
MEYCYGELHGQELKDMEQHIKSCEYCQKEVQEIRNMTEALDEMDELLCPDVEESKRPPERDMPESLPEIVDLDTLATWFGISSEELESQVKSIPHFYIAGKLRFRKSAVFQWIEKCETGTEGRQSSSEPGKIIHFSEFLEKAVI